MTEQEAARQMPLALRVLRARAGTWGEFIQKNRRDISSSPCPFCGCRSYFAWPDIEPSEVSNYDAEWSCYAFECARCGATFTSRDMHEASARESGEKWRVGKASWRKPGRLRWRKVRLVKS